MAYLVLARKHRPKTFSEMVGQEHVVQALTNALTSQRLHHAYLFTGTRGVGKTTVSRILAKSLNCQGADGQGGITATPCGICQACKDIDSGRFVDYTELDAASNRGVDEVQALLEQAVYKPVQGRFKVFMIDEVHMLTGHAFNAMLKTLEEPPEYLKFVLATTDPQKVPVTVLSRCLQFNLRPMAPETVLEHLVQVLQTEAVPAEPRALSLIARAARGSMRDALSLTDQAIAFGNGELLETGVRQMLGSVDRGHVFRLIEALAQGDGKTVVETSEGLRRDGLSAASTLEEMSTVLQAMAVLQAVPARAEARDAADPDAAETVRLAALLPADETQLLYSLCLHGRGELGLAPDEYAALTMVLLRLLAFKPAGAAIAEKKTLIETPAAAPRAIASPAATTTEAPTPRPMSTETATEIATAAGAPGAPEPERQPVAARPPGQRLSVVDTPSMRDAAAAPRPAAGDVPASASAPLMAMPVRMQPPPGAREGEARAPAAPIPPSEEGDFWHATVTQMVVAEAINALARELALQSQLVARDVDQWLLRVERESLNQTSSREKLQGALAAMGHGIRIAIEIGPVVDSPARRNRQAAEERQRVAEEAIRSDPDVQAMMRDWDAKIVPGTLRPA
ncbi:DNA polymerase III subunit gamma/tau [Variovorax sp. J22P168]|uniref:DNA polymerase III subunit gamma/tau n=1 Tax=Variovorax jilinensis TaxID=3053513 RepID=UPI002575D2CD|nr:DNA polymerase III subunit gamma/tau [Variovorax sp. J22P168]MDM0013526.1 DNA polymerase III subunit gamma/tau [Variovorax sp. J22P168]